MQTIQIVLEKELLEATDRAARRTKQNRSALVRDALRAHLRKMAVLEREQRDRAGYAKHPQQLDEVALWEREAVWPSE